MHTENASILGLYLVYVYFPSVCFVHFKVWCKTPAHLHSWDFCYKLIPLDFKACQKVRAKIETDSVALWPVRKFLKFLTHTITASHRPFRNEESGPMMTLALIFSACPRSTVSFDTWAALYPSFVAFVLQLTLMWLEEENGTGSVSKRPDWPFFLCNWVTWLTIRGCCY